MTTAPVSPPPTAPDVTEIAQKASTYPFLLTIGRLILTLILSVGVGIGIVFGATWYSIVFVTLFFKGHLGFFRQSIVHGFRIGSRANLKAKPTQG